jgi:hypothetical protein
MNKDLYDKSWDFPEEMRKHMKICFSKVKNADANVEGYNRNRRLQNALNLSYPELKRIKNFFDNYKGTTTDAPFILNGENKMKNFVDSILSGSRQSLSGSKNIRNSTGMVDKNYTKLGDANINMNITQDGDHKKSLEKYDLQVTESLRRINNLMKKIL